jgi:Na+/proline symporter
MLPVVALAVIVSRLPHGWSSLSSFAAAHGKDRLFDFSFDPTVPYTFWAGLIGGIFLALATHGTDQLNVQRYLSCRSQAGAARALAGSGLVVWGQFALFLLIGVGLACFYQVDSAAPIPEKDSAFAQFIVEEMPVGVVGVLLAAVFSAALSTLSSSLSASASAAVNDFYLPARREKRSARHVLWVSRTLTIAFGVIQMGVAMAGQSTDRSVVDSVLSIAGFATGPILGLFFLAVLAKRASRHGAMVGLTGGLIVLTAVALGTTLAWTWFAILGSTVTFLLGLIASMWLPDAPAVESP